MVVVVVVGGGGGNGGRGAAFWWRCGDGRNDVSIICLLELVVITN